MKVLITGIGSATGMSVAKAIIGSEHEIIGTDILDAKAIAGHIFCDKFFKVPKTTDKVWYIGYLLNIVIKERVGIIIPCTDIEAQVISEYAHLFKNVYLCVSPITSVNICRDKYLTYHFLKDNGFNTPFTTIRGEFIPYIDFDFPFIVKPRVGVGSIGVYVINNISEFCLVDRLERPLMQEKLEGKEFTADILAHDGKLIACVPRWRLEVRDGKSYKCVTFHDKELERLCEGIVHDLSLNGIICIQGFFDEGIFSFTEINPRPAASLPATTHSGVNLPLLAIEIAEKKPVKRVTEYKEISMIRYWSEVVYDV